MSRTLLASLFSAILALSLVGCGAPANDQPANTADETQGTEATDDAKANEKKPKEAPKADKKDEAVDEYEKPYERGVVDGNTYRNEFFGAAMTLPEEFSFLSDDEMTELFGEFADLYTDEGIKARLEGTDSYFDSMYCDMYTARESGDNVMFVIWKAPSDMSSTVSTTDASTYRDQTLSSLIATAEQSGANYEIAPTTIDVDGNAWPAIDAIRSPDGGSTYVYQRSVYLKCGYYYATFTMSSASEAGINEMTASLSALS